MAFGSSAASLLKAPTSLQLLIEEINFQRTKEMRQLLKDGKKDIERLSGHDVINYKWRRKNPFCIWNVFKCDE